MAEDKVTANAKLASDLADQSLTSPAETATAADSLASGTHVDEDDNGDEEDDDDAQTAEGVGGEVSSGKKKKKKKPKKKKASTASTDAATTTAESSSLPVRTVPVSDIPTLLKQLGADQRSQTRDGKDPSEYKFWNTQPVPKFKEPNMLQTTDSDTQAEGSILPDKVCKASIRPEPEKLLDGFEWCLVDLSDTEEMQELYDILLNHYVEDLDGRFRFKYSKKFLEWVLKPPGWKKEWHIGVRARPTQEGKNGKLVAFIAGTPVTLKVRDAKFNSVEINFLTIHRKLRSKRLAPVLIKEITRRCYQNDIFQALYTAGTLLPTPITTCRYYHRSLDWEHLYKAGFTYLPQGQTELRMKYKYKVDTNLSVKGMRPMEKRDAPAVMDLLVRYLERFHLRQEWTEEEIEHWLVSDASKDVVWSYVVEVDGKITDFVSYYSLESTVLGQPESIRAAYLYYYASESAFQTTSGNKKSAKQIQESLASRLQVLMHDLLAFAKKENFHVFNALTLLDNPLFLNQLLFQKGDGKLHYYLFNWRTKPLGGGINAEHALDTNKMGGIGVVML